MSNITVQTDGPITHVIMDRPAKHNAFNPALIQEMREIFEAAGSDPKVRVVVLSGAGKSFSAGADLDWMKGQGEATFEENLLSSGQMGQLFRTVDQCPKPVVAKVQGAALGGGSGLVCSADIAIAGPDAVFGFTEVRLGLVAAVISPFVVRRLGHSQAREKMLTGERFGPEEAYRIGLVHRVSDDLEAEVDSVIEMLLKGSSQAHHASKKLLAQIMDVSESRQLEFTARCIAEARQSEDGREGLSAFLEKRRPQFL